MEVAKLAAPPNLEVRFVSCNESAIKRWLSSELEETVFSLTHELFMTKHHTVTLKRKRQYGIQTNKQTQLQLFFCLKEKETVWNTNKQTNTTTTVLLQIDLKRLLSCHL